MTKRRLSLVLVVLPLLAVGCRCGPGVQEIPAVLAVSPNGLHFGEVKLGDVSELPVKLTAQVNAPVNITAITVEGGNSPGGAEAFSVVSPVTVVPELSDASFRLRFAPTVRQAYDATLVIASNDALRPQIRIPISGEGALPVLSVVPECLPSRSCRGSATVTPPAIDFGEEPLSRAVPLPVLELPTVTLINEGGVQLVVTHLSVEGADAAAFTFEGSTQLPHTGPDGAPALLLEAGEGVNLSVRFKPTSDAQEDYAAEAVIRSDDPDHAEVRVALSGRLGPNTPPQVCANITRVKPLSGLELNYSSKMHWDPLLEPPSGGYDFTASRDIRPRSTVTFSALSDTANDRACTTDLEDRRTGLSYEWTFVSFPPGAADPTLSGAQTPTATFTPLATGAYTVQLRVRDSQLAETTTTLRFVAALKQDLVVQASWNGRMKAYAGVDLDLHLVRPGSPLFGYFEEGPNLTTSGDLNGYAWTVRGNNDFDWGGPGDEDDPQLNLDETGGGALIENISLNFPERDPACATADCAYGVYLHYFKDARNHGAVDDCDVDATCAEGEVCGCPGARDRCVANEAPASASPTGAGRCLPAPEPSVQIFLLSSATPAAEIPLSTLVPPDELALGAPCQVLHVADVIWPAADGSGLEAPQVVVRGADGDGRITSPALSRYGTRASGGLECTRNAVRGGSSVPNWYEPEPL